MTDRPSEADTIDVTVAFEEETLAALNRWARREHGGYRGAAVSDLLERWLAERER